MFFDMRKSGNGITGWVSPDNPGIVPRIRIVRPDGSFAELDTNVMRPDVKEHGLHHTGQVGFRIDTKLFPDLMSIIDLIEIRDVHTGVLLYRPFRPSDHLPLKVFRFELQAMPYAAVEAAWDKSFALYYNAIERYPFDTMFSILNNPAAESIALSGRVSLNRYEHFFRERDYKIVTLLRPPLEEMAERLLFIRYALAPQSASTFDAHLNGLHSLASIAQKIKLEQMDGLNKIFLSLTESQKTALANPLVKALACTPDEPPRKHHVQVALARLSTMDLVGVRSHYVQFKAMLADILGLDILGSDELPDISWMKPLAQQLASIKAARLLVALDLQLYELAEGAVTRAIELGQGKMQSVMQSSDTREGSHSR